MPCDNNPDSLNGTEIKPNQWFIPPYTAAASVLSCANRSNDKSQFPHSASAYPAMTINPYSCHEIVDCPSRGFAYSPKSLCSATPLVYVDGSCAKNQYPSNCYLLEVGNNVYAPFRVKTPDDFLRSSLARISYMHPSRSSYHSATAAAKFANKKIGKKAPRQRKNFDSRIKSRILELYNSLIRSPKRYSIRMIAQSIYDTMRKEE